MLGGVRHIVFWLEDKLNAPENASASMLIRGRLIIVAFLGFAFVETFNFIGFLWAFDGLGLQHIVTIGVATGILSLLYVFQRTYNADLLAWLFGIGSLLGIWVHAFVDHVGQDSALIIGAPYTPYMIACLVFIALVGSERSALAFTVMSLATLIGFYAIGVNYFYSPAVAEEGKLGLVLRSSSIILTAVIIIPVGQIIHTSLDKIADALERAKEAEAAKASFLSTMSHEIRTPLNGILGMSDMLTRAELGTLEQRYASLIQVSANSLIDIVNEVLDLARMEDGRLEIASNPFEVASILQDTADLFTARAEEKSLWIGAHIDKTVPAQLMGDAPHLRQILNNLTSNAIKFTASGGIRVGAQCLGQKDGHAIIQFYVQDSGEGISPENQSKIFNRFEQTETGKKNAIKGTGLGLAICQELTTAMGGELRVKSESGQGSIFYFTLSLPLVKDRSLFVAA